MALIDCRFYSKYLAHQTEICVLLPDVYGRASQDAYPVLYLLHGRGDDCSSWVRQTAVERYAEAHQVAVVMPTAETSFYVDGVYGKRFYSFMTRELPDVVQRYFPVSRRSEDTYLAGLSMGGYGALKMALTEPARYAGVGIFSAGIRPDQFPDFAPTAEENEILHADIHRAFGAGPMAPADIPEALLRARVEEGVAIAPMYHYEGRQDFLYSMNQAFRAVAERLPIPYHYAEWDGGHDWIFWDEALRRLMDEFFYGAGI